MQRWPAFQPHHHRRRRSSCRPTIRSPAGYPALRRSRPRQFNARPRQATATGQARTVAPLSNMTPHWPAIPASVGLPPKVSRYTPESRCAVSAGSQLSLTVTLGRIRHRRLRAVLLLPLCFCVVAASSPFLPRRRRRRPNLSGDQSITEPSRQHAATGLPCLSTAPPPDLHPAFFSSFSHFLASASLLGSSAIAICLHPRWSGPILRRIRRRPRHALPFPTSAPGPQLPTSSSTFTVADGSKP